jgi:hypothetical protein
LAPKKNNTTIHLEPNTTNFGFPFFFFPYNLSSTKQAAKQETPETKNPKKKAIKGIPDQRRESAVQSKQSFMTVGTVRENPEPLQRK